MKIAIMHEDGRPLWAETQGAIELRGERKTMKRVTREIKTVERKEFKESDLLRLLAPELPTTTLRPANFRGVRIFMEVPGGGEWSGQELEVDNGDQRLIVEIETHEREETEEP